MSDFVENHPYWMAAFLFLFVYAVDQICDAIKESKSGDDE